MAKESLGYITAFVAAVLMGTLGLFVRHVSSSSELITFLRLFLSLFFLVILLVLTGQYNKIGVKLNKTNVSLFMSGIFESFAILFYIDAIKYTTLSNAVLLLYLGPLIATAFAHIFMNERVRPVNLILVLIAFLGIPFLFEFNFSLDLENIYGYIFGILSAILYSLYIIANRKIAKDITTINRFFYQFLFGSLSIFPVLFLGDTRFIIQDVPYLVLIGFLNGFLALSFLIVALQNLEAFKCGNILYTEAIVATAIGWIFF